MSERIAADELRLRNAREADLDRIVEVEDLSFPFPWPRSAFEQELDNTWSKVEVLCDARERVLAFIVYWVVHDELHLLDIAVHPEVRRQGVARRLMARLERVCKEQDLTYLTLECRVGNQAAITLYKDLGYATIHRRKRYYVDQDEDAWVMAKVLDPQDVNSD